MSQYRSRHKGMVSLEGLTYRIERLEPRTYAVVRLNDDVRIGTFKTGGGIEVFPEGVEAELLETIARDAVRSAKTSWVNHPAPSPVPARTESEGESVEPPASSSRRWASA